MVERNFTPFPALSTERLNLRQLSIEDDQEIFRLRTDKKVNEFIDRPSTPTIEIARNFINRINVAVRNNDTFFWALTLKNDNRLIGTILLWKIDKENSKAEIGYELLPEYHRQGIMQEAISTVIPFGFESLELRTIEAVVHTDNIASIRLLETNGFIRNTDAEIGDVVKEENKNFVVYRLRNNSKIES